MSDRSQYSWTQPICRLCWNHDHPDKPFGEDRDGRGPEERCSNCGSWTRSGVYIRVDPKVAAYPSILKKPNHLGEDRERW